jgi:hypothetical protein
MYDEILKAAGYTRYNFTVPFYNTDCWIKVGKPDINVDICTGLWASQTDDSGTSIDELTKYLGEQK